MLQGNREVQGLLDDTIHDDIPILTDKLYGEYNMCQVLFSFTCGTHISFTRPNDIRAIINQEKVRHRKVKKQKTKNKTCPSYHNQVELGLK